MIADACTLIHLRGEYLNSLKYNTETCKDTFDKYFDFFFARNCEKVVPCPVFTSFVCSNEKSYDCGFSTSIGSENINCSNITVSVT